jgi:predicted metal-dependent peptidase
MGDMPTIAVDEFGNMPYSYDFINGKSLEEVMFFVAHETLHIALEHIWRMDSSCWAWKGSSD